MAGINVNISALKVSELQEAEEEIANLMAQATKTFDAAGAAASEPIGSAIKGKFSAFNEQELNELKKAISEIIADLSNLSTNYSQGVSDLLADINSINITADNGPASNPNGPVAMLK